MSSILPRTCSYAFFLIQVLNLVAKKEKKVEFYDVCFTDYNVICLIATWLNDPRYDQNLFPDCSTVFCSDMFFTRGAWWWNLNSYIFQSSCV